MRAFHIAQVERFPGNIKWLTAERTSQIRQISWRQTLLFARQTRGQITPLDFDNEHRRLNKLLEDYRHNWHPALTDVKYLVTDFRDMQPDPNAIFNPREPGILYQSPLVSTTVAAMEWNSVMIMHNLRASYLPPKELIAKLSEHAFAVGRYYETLEYWPHTPNGVMIIAQAAAQTAALFMPRDEKHRQWLRRKCAYSEAIG